VVMLQATDIPLSSAFTLVGAEMMREMGMTVEIQAMDWATITSRRAKKEPVDQGGWHIFHTWTIGADLLTPVATNMGAGGDKAWFGWPSDARIEELRDEFAFAGDPKTQKAIGDAVQKRFVEVGIHALMGTFYLPCGYRENVKGMIRAPVQFFWNISV